MPEGSSDTGDDADEAGEQRLDMNMVRGKGGSAGERERTNDVGRINPRHVTKWTSTYTSRGQDQEEGAGEIGRGQQNQSSSTRARTEGFN